VDTEKPTSAFLTYSPLDQVTEDLETIRRD